MFANKAILVILLVSAWVIAGCVSETAPTVLTEPTSELVQSDIGSKDDFILRTASSFFTKRPLLIALSEMESKGNLWQGVSLKIADMEKCWIVEVDGVRQCENEDLKNFIGNPNALKIFFAPAYTSDSLGELYILDYHFPPVVRRAVDQDMQDTVDGYRLVIEFEDGKWVEKSLRQVY